MTGFELRMTDFGQQILISKCKPMRPGGGGRKRGMGSNNRQLFAVIFFSSVFSSVQSKVIELFD
jgi:hypothetical protein